VLETVKRETNGISLAITYAITARGRFLGNAVPSGGGSIVGQKVLIGISSGRPRTLPVVAVHPFAETGRRRIGGFGSR